MQLLRGQIKNVRHSIVISGGKENVNTSNVALFELEGFTVEIKLPDSIVICEGDDVKVAGKNKRGLFKGYAYFNVTKNVFGKGPTTVYMVVGTIFTVIGLALINLVLPALFAAAGIYVIYLSRLNSKAYSMVIS